MTDFAISPTSLVQFAVLDALLAGAYDGGIRAGELRASGDIGIGCCEDFDGEVVLLDGEPFACPVDGTPVRMADDETLPFAQWCRFPATTGSHLEASDLGGLVAAVEARLVSRNLFHAVRVDGVFGSVTTRATRRQPHPHPPLAEALRHQVERVIAPARGTLVGFWTPGLYQGIGVAGLHLHFLADDRSAGGHVLELTGVAGVIRQAALAGLDLRLPTDDGFLRAELGHDADGAIARMERGAGDAGE